MVATWLPDQSHAATSVFFRIDLAKVSGKLSDDTRTPSNTEFPWHCFLYAQVVLNCGATYEAAQPGKHILRLYLQQVIYALQENVASWTPKVAGMQPSQMVIWNASVWHCMCVCRWPPNWIFLKHTRPLGSIDLNHFGSHCRSARSAQAHFIDANKSTMCVLACQTHKKWDWLILWPCSSTQLQRIFLKASARPWNDETSTDPQVKSLKAPLKDQFKKRGTS